jgi:hypothetical protein
MEPRVSKRFYGVRAGDHVFTQFNPGDVCPPELVELATELDAGHLT